MTKIYNLTEEQKEQFRKDMEMASKYSNVYDALYVKRIDWSNVSFDTEEEKDSFLRGYKFWKKHYRENRSECVPPYCLKMKEEE